MHTTMRSLMITAGLIAPTLAWGVPAQSENKAYDSLEIIRTVMLTYPPELAAQNIDEGEVRAMVWVDETGRLLDWLLVGYTHPLLAKEVLEVLPKWKFKPARLQGQPINTRKELQFSFKHSEQVRVLYAYSNSGSRVEMRGVSAGRKSAQRVYDAEELDQPLDAVVEIAPRPPDRLGAVAREGSVVVEYLIDADGNVRMPLIISSDDEAFTSSVLLVITEWRYAVPRHTGHAVVARVRQKFTFSPTS
jgi:TonB family protein